MTTTTLPDFETTTQYHVVDEPSREAFFIDPEPASTMSRAVRPAATIVAPSGARNIQIEVFISANLIVGSLPPFGPREHE